jgi:hypothetical protein
MKNMKTKIFSLVAITMALMVIPAFAATITTDINSKGNTSVFTSIETNNLITANSVDNVGKLKMNTQTVQIGSVVGSTTGLDAKGNTNYDSLAVVGGQNWQKDENGTWFVATPSPVGTAYSYNSAQSDQKLKVNGYVESTDAWKMEVGTTVTAKGDAAVWNQQGWWTNTINPIANDRTKVTIANTLNTTDYNPLAKATGVLMVTATDGKTPLQVGLGGKIPSGANKAVIAGTADKVKLTQMFVVNPTITQ